MVLEFARFEVFFFLVEARSLMISAPDSGSSGPGLSSGRGHCVVFLGKTLYSYGTFPHPGV